MSREKRLKLAVWASVLFQAASLPYAFGQGVEEIRVGTGADHEIRYISGKVTYIETLRGDRFVGRFWSAEAPAGQQPLWDSDAFEIRIKEQPTPPSVAGALLSTGWRWVAARELARAERGARHFVVELSNEADPVTLKIHTLLDGTPVLTRWLEITNTSKKPLALTACFPWQGRLWAHGATFSLGSMSRNDVGFEGWFDWKSLRKGSNLITCRVGQGYNDPFFIVRNDSNGEYFIGHLAWSANWDIEFERDSGLSFKAGPTAVNPLRVIAPGVTMPPAYSGGHAEFYSGEIPRGETVTTPTVHLGYVKGDFDAAVQAMHDHIRKSVSPPSRAERCHRIEYLMPGDSPLGFYLFDKFTAANIIKCVDVAAAIGVELFIVDAGWWDGDKQGDWTPSATRFPHGLEEVSNYVHQKGMHIGLYYEAERAYGKNSRVAKEHPDWIMPQYVLNMANPETAAWVESESTNLIERYKLDLFRVDYNPEFTFEGPSTYYHSPWATVGAEDFRRLYETFEENSYWRYYEHTYGMYERLLKRFPDLILQQAAAGGARSDLGMALRFHEQFPTDWGALPHSLQTLSGMSAALPPETLVIPYSIGDKNDTDLVTRLRATFTLGTPQIFTGVLAPSTEELKKELADSYRRYVNMYKTFIRPVLPTCKVYHHAPVNATGGVESGDWFAMEFGSPDGRKGWATIIRLSNSASESYLFKPKGLDGGRKYRVTFDNTGKSVGYEGSRLMREGIAVHLKPECASELLSWQAD